MLQQDIEAKFLEAYKTKDETRVSTLRLLKAALVNKMIEKKMAKTEVLGDEDVMAAVKAEIKKRQEAKESYQQGGRADLAGKEAAEAVILAEFLPEQLAEDEVRQLVLAAIAQLAATPADFGKVMGAVLGQAKGRTDGAIVSRLVKEELGK